MALPPHLRARQTIDDAEGLGLMPPTPASKGFLKRSTAGRSSESLSRSAHGLSPSQQQEKILSRPIELVPRDHNASPKAQFGSACEAIGAQSLSYALAKRLLDLTIGCALIIIAAPVIALAALWIRAESPGSPFFFQTRLGKNGRPFRIFKLRGMYIDARERFPQLYDYSKNRDLEFHFHYRLDPRVTKAGRFLRRTSIDELPNLWNVIVGDMSLVGPRPEIPEILAMYGPYRERYLSVKPGISCLSKCTGRDHLTKRESIEIDLQYIRDRSLSKDLAILAKTVFSVLGRHNVF